MCLRREVYIHVYSVSTSQVFHSTYDTHVTEENCILPLVPTKIAFPRKIRRIRTVHSARGEVTVKLTIIHGVVGVRNL